MKYFIVITLVTIQNQLVTSQMLRQPPFNLINRQIGEKLIETGSFINPPPQPTVITEPPCNSIVPIPRAATSPSTTIITDCSPTVCQNLANTIQLMIVCNLLQNSKSSELATQLAGPILNEVMSSPTLSCGCNNPLSPGAFSSSIIAPNGPNFITPNFVPSNVGPNLISPNFGGPNIYSPNFVNPNVVSPNFISPNMLPLAPRGVPPTNACPNNVLSGMVNQFGPNSPLAGPANANLLNTIMSMLGNIQG